MFCIFWAATSSLSPELFPDLIPPEYKEHGVTGLATIITIGLGFLGSFWGLNILKMYRWIKEELFQKTFRLLEGEDT
jgi:hypothetical protein